MPSNPEDVTNGLLNKEQDDEEAASRRKENELSPRSEDQPDRLSMTQEHTYSSNWDTVSKSAVRAMDVTTEKAMPTPNEFKSRANCT